MDNGKISVRYARALLNTANELQCGKMVYEGMARLSENYNHASTQFYEALSNPMINGEEKFQLLLTATGDPVHPCLQNFFRFLIEKKRENKIQLIALQYQEMYRAENHLLRADVTTAVAPDEKTLRHIREFVENTFHCEAEIHLKVNPALIGGFTLDIEHERLDASIAGRLQHLKEQLNIDN